MKKNINKVAILQRFIPHYRVEFFNHLQKKLATENIQLTVFSGSPILSDAFNDGFDNLSCGIRVKNHLFLNNRVYWQNLFYTLRDYNLVIVEHSNAALLNLPLLLSRRLFRSDFQFAYWGHGAALDGKSNSLREKFKRLLVNKADHWFGYTEHTRILLQKCHVTNNNITIVNNSIDTSDILAVKQEYNLEENKKKWGITNGSTIVFCSRLSKNKEVPFIIESCRIARKKITNLNLIIIGDGPLKKTIEGIVKYDTWIILAGALYGIQKANVLLLGDMMALPSGVGLSILDAFAADLPILISDFKNNGPEIAYFEDGKNGLFTNANPESYANAIVRLSSDSQLLQKLKKSSSQSALHYTVKNMTDNFAIGIKKTLGLH